MKHIHTFESFLNENANKKITVSLSSSAVESFKKDLDTNKIAYTIVRPTVFELEDTPKARTAIQEAKGRFGMQSVLVTENYELDASSVVNEDFPGPGETVLAKDITPAVLDYFDRTNKKLLIDTKTKKGITGEVGRMYNDLVFNGDTIQLKDIIQVKILESTNDAVNEDQRFLNFRYATGMDKIQIDSIENYRKEQKPTTEFEKAAKPFGSLPGVFVFTPQTPKEVETIKLLATKHSVFGIWAVNNKGAEVFIARAS